LVPDDVTGVGAPLALFAHLGESRRGAPGPEADREFHGLPALAARPGQPREPDRRRLSRGELERAGPRPAPSRPAAPPVWVSVPPSGGGLTSPDHVTAMAVVPPGEPEVVNVPSAEH